MTTYWLTISEQNDSSSDIGAAEHIASEDWLVPDDVKHKTQSLVDWNVTILLPLLKQIIARRKSTSGESPAGSVKAIDENLALQKGTTVLDEVEEIIFLPEFDARLAKMDDPGSITLPQPVVDELGHYVMSIAHMYTDNDFHCFEHASHVVMSVSKLLSRIVAPELGATPTILEDERQEAHHLAASLHDHTYGITSDPLTQFACAFSALIHDVDHQGVPNTRLMEENPALAATYQNRSVAE